MSAVLNDGPEANHNSLPLLLAPNIDAHTLGLVDLERLPQGKGNEVDEETQSWAARKPVEYSGTY